MIGTAIQIINKLLNAPRDEKFELTEYKEKRSLNANNYAWALMVEIGNKLNLSKEEVYKQMLIDYGQSTMISVLANVDVSGYFKYYKEAGRSELNGKEFVHYKVYKGSSEYNTKEMSILIDGIVQECKQLDIETKTNEEIESLIDLWGKNDGRNMERYKKF